MDVLLMSVSLIGSISVAIWFTEIPRRAEKDDSVPQQKVIRFML